MEYFILSKGQRHPERFKSIAYGQYKTIAANNNEKNRALNRRVNILFVVSEKEGSTK